MMPKRKTNPPPDPVYRAGKKKERATKAIRALEGIQADLLELTFDNDKWTGLLHGIKEILPAMKSYRKILDR